MPREVSRAKISVTIAISLAREIEEYWRELLLQAAREGKSIPKLSRVYEEILLKGWEATQRERKRGGEK
jgi:hypothetical protein